MIQAVILWWFIANIFCFVLMGVDKAAARGGHWRIPEASLLGLALLGGSVGLWLAMQRFRHKTKKQPFRSCALLLLLLHLLVTPLALFSVALQ